MMPNYHLLSRPLKQVAWIFLAVLLQSVPTSRADEPAPKATEVARILAGMEAAFAKVECYQTEMEVRDYRAGKPAGIKRFLYSFKKPDKVRIDMETPKRGTVLVYPDEQGKVSLRGGLWTGFATLHLKPGNSLLASGNGQRIDQSDFGQLIGNIRHSLTDRRRGEVRISEAAGKVSIEVLADDHFLPGVRTRYRFVIDKERCLPLEVHEADASGTPRKTSSFAKLRTSVALSDSLFRIR